MIKGRATAAALTVFAASILVPVTGAAQVPGTDNTDLSVAPSGGAAESDQSSPNAQSAAQTQPPPADEEIPLPPRPKTLGDEVPRGETVGERPRPDYDPLGQAVGAFVVFPNLNVLESFESNILGTPSHPIGDFITSIQPSLDVKSNWNNHALNFHFDGSLQKYAENSSQNYNDYTISSNGRLDIYHDAELFGGVGYSVRHQPVWSPNNPGDLTPSLQTVKPEQYGDLAGSLALEKTFDRLSFRLQSNYDEFTFANVTSTSDILVPLHLENYDQELVTLRTAYELAPLRQIYLLTSYNWRNYAQTIDLSGYDRTSSGYVAAAGVRYDLTGITFVDVYAGYLQQGYKDPRLPVVTGLTGGAKLTWNVTRLTTLTGSVDRGLQETIIPGVSGYFDTRAVLQADHELLRNVVLNGSLGLEQDAFQGLVTGIAGQPPAHRTDNYYFGEVGAKYLINRHFSLSLNYTFLARDSTQSGNGFTDHIILLGLSAHL